MSVSQPTLVHRRPALRRPGPPRSARWLAIVSGPLRVALAPLAWVLAGIDVAVRRPSVVVAAAVLLVCVPSNLQYLGASVTVADVAIAGAVALVAVRLLAGDRAVNRRGWLPFVAMVVSVAIAAITASQIAEGLQTFARYMELFVLVPVTVAMALRDRLDVLLVAGSVVATTVIEGSVGIYQYLTGTGASYAGEFVRAVGTFGAEQVVALGALIGYGIVVTLALGLAFRGRPRIVLLATAALLVLPLAASLSRGAWIATAVAVLVTVAVFSWRLAVSVVGVTALVLTVMVLGVGGASTGVLDERLTSIVSSGSAPDRSVQDRYALWGAAVDMWVDHPITGVGLKGFAEHRDSYAPMSLSAGSDVDDPTGGFRREPLLSPHNQYLMVLSEQGTVGIVAFGTLLGTLTVGAVLRRRRAAPPEAGEARSVDERFLDFVALGLMAWTLIDFLYGDIGAGPSGVVLAVLLGIVARRRVIVPRPADSGREVTS